MADAQENLEQTIDNLQHRLKSLKKEMETKDNKLYEYKNQLNVVKEREIHYLHEIDVLQSQEKPEANKLRDRIKQLQEELAQLNDHRDSELSKQDDELKRLQDEIKMRSEEAFDDNEILPITTNKISEENFKLESELQIINNELCKKALCMEQLQEQNIKLSEIINRLRLELEQVKENMDCKKQDLVEAYDLMNNLQEDVLLTKTELGALKGKLVKPSDSENSLFAEVNDRRLKLRETLLSLSEKCNKMREEVSKKQKQISTLRLHNEELTNLLKNDPLECQQDYKTLNDTYISRISTLKYLSEEYDKLSLEKLELREKGLPSNIVEFLHNLTEENRKNEEKLKEAVGMEFRAQKMMAIQLKEIDLKVREWKTTTKQLEMKLLDCENFIKKLTLQHNNPEINENNTHNEKENCKRLIGNYTNEDKHEEKQKLITETDRANSLQKTNINEINNKPSEKRVMFTADTIDSKSSSNHTVRKGRKVLQSKSIYIPSLIKKKEK